MSMDLDQIRALAQRVAASHGLDVVEVEFLGGGKHRTLRVYIEKNAAERRRIEKNAAERARIAREAEEKKSKGKVEGADLEAAEKAAADGKAAGDESAAEGEGDFPSGFEGRIDQLAGVTHEDCEAFSTDFGTVLDVEDLVGGSAAYDLEVSSPGLDRKLYGPEDYKRFAGNLARLQTREPVDGNRHWQGRIGEVQGSGFELELAAGGLKGAKAKASGKKAGKSSKAGARSVRLEFNNIEKANLEPEI
jgi:ribosome maturation factor RimP